MNKKRNPQKRGGFVPIGDVADGLSLPGGRALTHRAATPRRCCTNRHWPARCQPTGFSPADAIRHWSAEGDHPIDNRTAEDGLTPLPSWAPGAKAISDDGLVAEERVLHPALTMVPVWLLRRREGRAKPPHPQKVFHATTPPCVVRWLLVGVGCTCGVHRLGNRIDGIAQRLTASVE